MVRLSKLGCIQSVIAIVLVSACAALLIRAEAYSRTAPLGIRAAAPVSDGQRQKVSSEVATIRTYSNLVVVDVVVNDSQGNPIHGLKASDFTLMENNKLQTVKHFEEHSEVPANDVKLEDGPKLPPGLFANQTPAPVNGPVNVLLLDYLNTPLTYQLQARQQLLDYLDKAPPGTRIAIFALTTHLLMLQGFTSDMSVLKAALTAGKSAPQFSDILSDPINGGPIADRNLADTLTSLAATSGENAAAIQRFEDLHTSFQEDMIAQYTLGAFDMLARYLIGMPGRKNVIWFSGGFPLDVEPDINVVPGGDPNAGVVRNDELVRKTDNLLTRAQVAVYPVDARGVMIDPALNADPANEPQLRGSDPSQMAHNIVVDPTVAYSSWLNETAQEHETMEAMAEDTGGTPFYNTNGLTQAVQKAIRNGSNYYTLTYSPTNTQWDERFRSIKVVDQAGVKLSYRNGYYAFDPNDRNPLNAGQAATARVRPPTMATAMMHGGPDPAEILFKVRIRPADAPPAPTPLQSNRTNRDPKVKVEVEGPYKEYGVDLVPDPHAVRCQQDGSNRHCAIEMWTYVYDREGQLLVTVGNRIYRRLTPADYQKLLAGNMAFHQEISVPVKGEHYLRTAIHDMVSDRVGAVEVPVAAVAKLDPLKPLPAVPATTAGAFANGAPPDASSGAAADAAAPAAVGTGAPGTPAVSVPVSGTVVAPPAQGNTYPTLKRRTEAPDTTPVNPPGASNTPN